MKTIILFGKLGCIPAWLWVVACLVFPGTPGREFGLPGFFILSLAHLLEIPFYLKSIRALGGNPIPHFFQIYLFGFFHQLAMKEALAAREAGPSSSDQEESI